MCGLKSVLLVFAFIICTAFASPITPENYENSINIGPKIINGTLADPEKTKHQVSLRLINMDYYFGGGHICGGTVVAPSIVLTAAHCIYNYQLQRMRTPDEFIVSMGSVNRYDQENSTTFEVLAIDYKDTFNISTFVDDIAIIIINGFIPTGHPNIQKIPIDWEYVPEGTVCQVTGWGVTEDGYTSDLLMSLDVPIANHTQCSINYEGYVRDGMICAGYMEGMKDACNGDSGGPLVCNGKLVGIVSFGSGCALPDYPGVYTEVRYHSEWLQRFTGGVGFIQSSTILLILTIPLFLIF